RSPRRCSAGRRTARRPGGRPVRSGRAGGLEDEHRDLARGPLLVLGVGRVRSDRALPPLGALVPGYLPGHHVLLARAVLHLHARVRAEVVVPERVGRGTALRRDRGVPAVVLDPHHRGLAQLAAARPAVGDDHHGQAGVAQRGGLRPARALVLLDLLADPGPRARLVLTLDRHGARQHLRRYRPVNLFLILVTQVGEDAVVVGELRLIGREDAQAAAQRGVAHPAAPGPGRQHVIEAAVGIKRHRGERVLVGPGAAGRSVARDLPGVVEDQA